VAMARAGYTTWRTTPALAGHIHEIGEIGRQNAAGVLRLRCASHPSYLPDSDAASGVKRVRKSSTISSLTTVEGTVHYLAVARYGGGMGEAR
jgi:hypothetical protein